MGLCCLKIAMYSFLFFNHLCFILGTLIFGCGIWIQSNKSPFGTLVQISAPSFEFGIYAFIAVGAITMFMGFLGCMGAFYGIQCLLGLYIFFMVLILIAQVSIGAFIFSQGEVIEERTTETILDLIEVYNPIGEKKMTLEVTWDSIQFQFSCCGFNGPKDWQENLILKNENYTLYPCSCHNGTTSLKGFCPLETSSTASGIEKWPVVQQGCKETVQRWINEHANIILGISISVGIVEFFGMTLSLCIYCNKQRTQEPGRF